MLRFQASIVAFLFVIISGCSGKPSTSAAPGILSDSARGRELAALVIPGDTDSGPVFTKKSGQPKYPRSLHGQDATASLLLAFVVDQTGRVELGSRTVIAFAGDRLFVKAVCDFVAGTRLSWKQGTPKRVIALAPFAVSMVTGENGELPRPQVPKLYDPVSVTASQWSMTPADRQQWFTQRPSCAEF